MRRLTLLATAAAVAVVTAVLTAPAQALAPAANNLPTPSSSVCSEWVYGGNYACMKVNKKAVPSGETALFTGTLSSAAMTALKAWTKGDNVVCLTRYNTKPLAGGAWPWQYMEGVCTTVRKSGQFTLRAEFGRKGTFYYGLEMGPCRAGTDLCGDGDPGLIGVYNRGDKALQLKTT